MRTGLIVCFDFDGVIHLYTSGWKGIDIIPDGVVPGAIEAIIAYQEAGYSVVIHSSRSRELAGITAMRTSIYNWLLDYFRPAEDSHYSAVTHNKAQHVYKRLEFPANKPPAHLTIDDRGHCFTGVFPTPDEVKAFKPWNKKE